MVLATSGKCSLGKLPAQLSGFKVETSATGNQCNVTSESAATLHSKLDVSLSGQNRGYSLKPPRSLSLWEKHLNSLLRPRTMTSEFSVKLFHFGEAAKALNQKKQCGFVNLPASLWRQSCASEQIALGPSRNRLALATSGCCNSSHIFGIILPP